ncbi:GntR family transcriptional regulator [Shouchella shacheensis]|uniref:GntR family transcriptional regulator n=1 Tax=Shouchella shacheensis TaxID=1649580 RepID=UPI0007402368|nr:GntR family transcriptional regulator [Shouchella shacheensis]
MSNAKNGSIFEYLWNAIKTGEIESGQMLTERDLARNLGVSRTPIREALRRLEKYGLVQHEPHKGVRVISVSTESVKQLYEIREILEGFGARILAEHATKEDISTLEDILHQAETAAEEDDIYTLSKINANFHTQLAQRSGNKYLESIMQTLQSHISLVMSKSLKQSGRPDQNIAEHWMILEAIKQKDPQLAESITKYHVRKAMSNAISMVE